ncbi:uncharacterized protein LOC124421385 [Lucilia cuprina]|uniref:uncharacterized protein LOC124421385 n=1 Tax=Lucilia cuprina TaxID=7375 RepID=UPI001F05FC2E|nr:uncharacterized protein LOC124421385 [Lucilia cuprina]
MFTAIYGNHPRLTQAQKLYHLRNKTKGEAGSIVAKYPLSDQNYLLAWDALRARYENKRILVDNQLKILFNIPAAKAENCESINRIQTTISDCLSILKAHGIRTDQWDPILIYLCSTKLPDETLALWEQSLSSPTRLPSWAEMEEFLINRHQVMERISTFRSQNPAYVPYHNQGRNYNISSQLNKARYENPNKGAQSKNDDMLCKLCNKTHII